MAIGVAKPIAGQRVTGDNYFCRVVLPQQQMLPHASRRNRTNAVLGSGRAILALVWNLALLALGLERLRRRRRCLEERRLGYPGERPPGEGHP